MAQVNFLFDDDGRVISGINGNGTSAITAGDILYASPPSTSPFGTTVPSGVDYDEIEVEPVKFATATGNDAQGNSVVGVALHDAAAGSQVSFSTEGLFLSPIIDTTGWVRAGNFVRAAQGESTSGVVRCGTTTGATVAEFRGKIGVAITSANTTADYVLWKFTR
tara:strand:- start:1760 stop:2251 length:492 start_codon:yes stop_codon:yes gene_type:complete